MTRREPRSAWELEGARIADETNSPPVEPDRLEYIVVHYPAARTISGSWQQWARRAQADWIGRGYSWGYNWAYWWGTDVELEVRGWDYRNAANNVPDDPDGDDENRISVALLVIVPGLGDDGRPASALQVGAVRDRVADIWERAGRRLPLVVHGDLKPTSCAGAGVNAQTRAGEFLPRASPTDPPAAPAVSPLLTRAHQGDGYWSIARRVYGLATTSNVDQLVQANAGKVLRPGDLVVVPGRAVI